MSLFLFVYKIILKTMWTIIWILLLIPWILISIKKIKIINTISIFRPPIYRKLWGWIAIIWIVIILIIYWIVKNIFKAKWIVWIILYNEDFLLKPYSKSDMDLINSLRRQNIEIITEEILIFKWFLWRAVFSTLHSNWINTEECDKIIKELDRRFPLDFPEIKSKLNEDNFKQRFTFYNKKLIDWIKEDWILDISNLFQTWKLTGTSYNPIANLAIGSYLKLEYQKLTFVSNHYANNPNLVKYT